MARAQEPDADDLVAANDAAADDSDSGLEHQRSQHEAPMEHEGSDYEDEGAGGMYHAGDKFIKIWDASAYLDVAANPEAEWSANYDQTAIEARGEFDGAANTAAHGYNGPMLMRELIPSAEYADDILPFCSNAESATYRISCMRRGLLRRGGVMIYMALVARLMRTCLLIAARMVA